MRAMNFEYILEFFQYQYFYSTKSTMDGKWLEKVSVYFSLLPHCFFFFHNDSIDRKIFTFEKFYKIYPQKSKFGLNVHLKDKLPLSSSILFFIHLKVSFPFERDVLK